MAKVSVALVGDNFYLCGPCGNNIIVALSGAASHEFRQQFVHPDHIHHSYVALGLDNSYFIQFFDDKDGKQYATWSLSAYPSLIEHLLKSYKGNPVCVSLGENGHYFYRDDYGSAWNLPKYITEDVLTLHDEEDPVVKLWLGKDDAYYAESRSGSAIWNLRGNYGSLGQVIKYDTSGARALGMNLEDDRSYFILCKNFQCRGNVGHSTNGLTMERFNCWYARFRQLA